MEGQAPQAVTELAVYLEHKEQQVIQANVELEDKLGLPVRRGLPGPSAL